MMQRFGDLLLILLLSLVTINGAPFTTSPSTDHGVPKGNPEEAGGYYQGDMILQPPTSGRGVAIRPIASERWTNGVVPYEFASNISMNNSLFIVRMMREIENLTAVNNVPCVSFRPKNSSDPLFITIHNGSGCSAPVGSWPGYTGVRPVSFMHSPTSTCMISGTIQHELTHVLGFYHEQSRPDRDTYVSIQWSNIQPSSAFNFDKYNNSDVDTQGTPYDYGSVMHYGATAFAINSSSPTIIAIFNSSAALGQRVRLSPIDILEIQRAYGCVANPTTTTSTSTSGAPAPTTTTTMAPAPTTTTTMAPAPTTTSVTTTTTTRTTTTSATTTSATTATTTSVTTATTTSVTTVTVTTVTITDGVGSLFKTSQFPLWAFCLLSSTIMVKLFH